MIVEEFAAGTTKILHDPVEPSPSHWRGHPRRRGSAVGSKC